MKKILTILLVSSLAFMACEKSANELPIFSNIEITEDNSAITVSFSEGVYANNNKTGDLSKENIKLTCNDEDVQFNYTVAHSAGADYAVLSIEYFSAITGDEIFTVMPTDEKSIFDEEGEAMITTESINTDPLSKKDYGITGEWYSSGDNVAVLLVTYFAVDSIYANFEPNNTYVVESYAEGAKTTYSGTYTQEKSGIGSIWNIVLNQSSPSAVTSEGIFEITEANNSFTMKYEVAQTEPNIGATAPTAAAGFGSTSGGALGTMNIQNFIKIQD